MTLDDKYTCPDSGGVLVNRLDIRDLGRLDQALNAYASVAWVRLRQLPPLEPPGFDYLQTIHRQMLESHLDWAGELRRTDAQATGTGIAYARPEYIFESLQSLFRKLEREDFLSGLHSSAFTDRLADRWRELSAIRPFRDGNTRSQSAYISAITERTEHLIDWRGLMYPRCVTCGSWPSPAGTSHQRGTCAITWCRRPMRLLTADGQLLALTALTLPSSLAQADRVPPGRMPSGSPGTGLILASEDPDMADGDHVEARREPDPIHRDSASVRA